MPKKRITMEDFARMTQRGFREISSKMDKKFAEVDRRFEEVDKRFKGIDKRFEGIDKRLGALELALTKLAELTEENFRHVFARLDRLREDISDLPTMREELYALSRRVERLERKVGAAR